MGSHQAHKSASRFGLTLEEHQVCSKLEVLDK